MAAMRDPRLKLAAHSSDVVAQFEAILASNLGWLTDHVDEVQVELSKGVSLARLIKTPKRPKQAKVPLESLSPCNRPANPFLVAPTQATPSHAAQSANPFASGPCATKNNKPSPASIGSERARTSTASSLEDEAAIEAALLAVTRPADVATAVPAPPVQTPPLQVPTPKKQQLPRPKTPVLSPKASQKSLRGLPVRSHSPAPRPNSPLPRHIAKGPIRPQSPSHIPTARPMTPVRSLPAAIPLPSPSRQTPTRHQPLSDKTYMDVDPPAPLAVQSAQCPVEQPVLANAASPVPPATISSSHEQHDVADSGPADTVEGPEAVEDAPRPEPQEKVVQPAAHPTLPPSPISAFLSNHTSRPSVLSFKGLPNREKSTGLAMSKRFSSRATLGQPDVPTTDSESTSLKRKSDMLDFDSSDRYSKLFKADAPKAPQTRIEALKTKVQNMSKGIAQHRLSTEPAASVFSQPTSQSQSSQSQPCQVPSQPAPRIPPQTSKAPRSPVSQAIHAFGTVPTPATGRYQSPKPASVGSPAVRKAFQMFAVGSATVENAAKSPDRPFGLVRQSSVTDLVRAFESRNAVPGHEGSKSPRKVLRTPEIGAIAESTTPPNTPPAAQHPTHEPESEQTELVSSTHGSPMSVQHDAPTMRYDFGAMDEDAREEPALIEEALSNAYPAPAEPPQEETFQQAAVAPAPAQGPTLDVSVLDVPVLDVCEAEQDTTMTEVYREEDHALSTTQHEEFEAEVTQITDWQESYRAVEVEIQPATSGLASGFLSQAANLLSKSLGTNNVKKVPSAAGLKSLQLAAAAKDKEQQLKDKKAALKEEREQQRRLVVIAKEQEEQRKQPAEVAGKPSEVKRPDSALSRPIQNTGSILKPKGSTASTISQTAKAKASRLQSTSKVTLDGPEKLSTAYKPATGPSRAPSVAADKPANKPREPSRSAQPLVSKAASKPILKLKAQASGAAPPVLAPSQKPVAKPAKPVVEQPESEPYMELPDIASEYSDSDDDNRNEKAAALPDWVQSPELRAKLVAQSSIDPDDIFGAIQPLRMEEMFRGKTSRFRARTSSAYWSGADALTQAEEAAYAKRMNYTSSKLRE